MNNRDYWAKMAEHNRSYMNHADRYARHCGRGRILGKVIFFGLGYVAATFVNRRYHSPSANPRQQLEEMKNIKERPRESQPGSHDSSELKDIINKVKQLEKKYRKPQPSDESKPSTSNSSDSPAPRSSE